MKKKPAPSFDQRELFVVLLDLSEQSTAYDTFGRFFVGQDELTAVNTDLGLDL
jgi:hypothetical protein